MSEQDTSKWALDKTNTFIDYSGLKGRIDVESNDMNGVWLELHAEDANQYWYTWIPPEVAEAMGTMLLYAAQEWRQKHGDPDTDPR